MKLWQMTSLYKSDVTGMRRAEAADLKGRVMSTTPREGCPKAVRCHWGTRFVTSLGDSTYDVSWIAVTGGSLRGNPDTEPAASRGHGIDGAELTNDPAQ